MKLWCLFALILCAPALAQFSNETEVSMIQTGGNTQVQTNNAKTLSSIKWHEKNTYSIGGHYTYGETKEAVSARNWDVSNKYERQISPRFSLVFGEIIEGNRFIDIKSRYNTDVGLKYYYIKAEKKNFFSELGYRYTIEDRYEPLPNTFDNKARLYNEFDHKYSETMQYKIWLEYVPNFTDTRDYLVNGEASITSILTSTFSLKVAYKGMYDNRPANADFKNYDYLTTTSIVAKF